MNSRWVIGVIITVTLSLPALGAAPVYRIKELPVKVGTRYFVSIEAINDLGQFVGASEHENGGRLRGFRWDPATASYKLLAPLDSSTPNNSWAYDINNKGQVVGSSGNRAVRWGKDGVPRALAALPGEGIGRALALNEAGQVVGTYDSSRYAGIVGVLWQAGSVMVLNLPIGQEYQTEPLGINDNGYIVGRLREVDHFLPWVWDPTTGKPQILPILVPRDYTTTGAFDISNVGQIVGTSSDRAATWNKTTRAIRDLHSLLPPGYYSSFIRKISTTNEMIGSAWSIQGGSAEAFLWKANIAYKLDTLINPTSPHAKCVQFNEFVKVAISNNGVILTQGRNICTNTFHTYVLTPIT